MRKNDKCLQDNNRGTEEGGLLGSSPSLCAEQEGLDQRVHRPSALPVMSPRRSPPCSQLTGPVLCPSRLLAQFTCPVLCPSCLLALLPARSSPARCHTALADFLSCSSHLSYKPEHGAESSVLLTSDAGCLFCSDLERTDKKAVGCESKSGTLKTS